MTHRRRLILVTAVVVAVLAFGAVAYAALPLTDISGHWAENAIVSMFNAGVVQGRVDGTFHPDDSITRAEVATMFDRVATNDAAPIDARRGCTDCHVGNYSLKNEAVSRGGAVHDVLSDDIGVDACLFCHGPAADGKGANAPLSLRDIVHPAHMGSKIFVDHYMGNCFTCHNVDYEGTFQVLGVAVDTDAGGIPDTVPIPGALDPK